VEQLRYILDGFNIDVIDDSMIVLHTPNTISVIYPDFTNKNAQANREVRTIGQTNLREE
jgi:hypothetical protein